MKEKLGFLLLIALMTSCKSKEGSTHIFSHESDDFRVSISTIDTKINYAGIAQCSKYAKTTVSDTVYTSYGLELSHVIATALETTPKYISGLPFHTLKNKYLEIRIENYIKTKLDYDSLLLFAVSRAFDLKIFPKDSVLNGYELMVIDEEKLNQSRSACEGGIIKYKDGIWTATSSRLLGLTKIVDQYSESYICFDAPDQNCYSFEFVTGDDFDKINAKLKPLGLMFNRTAIEQTFYKIKTVANKTYNQ